MFLASKIMRGGIALTLLTTAMLGQAFPRSSAESDSNKDGVTVFVIKSEIKKVQQTLQDKGDYRGKIDGVFGLGTRSGIRAYQKAENLPITGQVDVRTAAGLGVRPESTWDDSERAGRYVGYDGDIVIGAFRRDKPSAGIRWAAGKGRRTSQKEVARAGATEDNREGGANKQQGANEEHDQ